MKKYIFLFISAAVLSISCTKGGLLETPASYAEEIVFEPYLGNAPETKAENSNLSVLRNPVANNQFSGGFLVHAFEYGDGKPIDFTDPFMSQSVFWVADEEGNSGTWEQEYTYYWPEKNYLSFAAVGLNAVNGGCLTNIKEDDLINYTKYNFAVKSDVAQQVDLIASRYQSDKTSADAVINIKFEHLLSRIGFKIQATDENEGVDIVIRDIKLCGSFPINGEVNLTEVDENGKPFITVHDSEDDQFQAEYSLFTSSTDCFKVSSQACSNEAAEIYANSVLNPSATSWSSMYSPKYVAENYIEVPEDGGDPTPEQEAEAEAKAAKEDAIAKNRRYMMLLPSTQTFANNARVEVTYQLTDDNARVASVALGEMTFEPGCTYEFRLLVSTASIEFDATLEETGWDNGPDVTTNTIPLFPLK